MGGIGQPYRSLSVSDRNAYLAALTESHRINVSCFIYDAAEALIGALEGYVAGGQVDVDATADITRTLSLSIEDPALKFVFDPIGPIYADKFIQVVYSVDVPGIGWVDVPVFYGSISRYARDGHDVTIEAVSKEALMLPPTPPSTPAVTTDRRLVGFLKIVAQAHGESRFRLGDGYGKIVSSEVAKQTIDAAQADGHSIWGELSQLCDDKNFQLFYDTEGYLSLRRPPTHRLSYTFTGVANEPSVGFDLTLVRNRVKVFGTDQHGHDVLKAVAILAASHPLSQEALARGGVNRVLLENVKTGRANLTVADAERIANRHLKRASDVMVDVSFDSLVVPHLEVGDLCRLSTDTIDATFGLGKFSIPLGAGDLMSVGTTKRLGFHRYRRRIKGYEFHGWPR